MKLPSEIKTKINRFSHAAGIAHGEQVKRRLMTEAAFRLSAGESIAEIREYLERGGGTCDLPIRMSKIFTVSL